MGLPSRAFESQSNCTLALAKCLYGTENGASCYVNSNLDKFGNMIFHFISKAKAKVKLYIGHLPISSSRDLKYAKHLRKTFHFTHTGFHVIQIILVGTCNLMLV